VASTRQVCVNRHSTDDALRRAWEEQPEAGAGIGMPELKRKARSAQRRVAVRNGVEYAAVLSVVVVAGAMVVEEGPLLLRLSALLMAAGMLYLVAQLHARASARKPPRDGTATEYLGFLQHELARQQRAARSAWRWYFLPFVPGTVVFVIGSALEDPEFPWPAMLAGFAVLFLAVHLLNRFRASRIGKRLAELSALIPGERAPPNGQRR